MANGGSKQSVASIVESLQSEFGSKCKVVEDVGEFSFVVTFRITNQVTMKVQFPGNFPTDAPVVYGNELRVIDALKRWETSGFSLHELTTIVSELFDQFGSDSDAQTEKGNAANHIVNQRVKKERNRSGNEETTSVEQSEKKSRMRTVEEVVQRVIWDADIDRQKVYVGYEDRFRGVLEKRFDDFGFEIDVVDSDERVPLHRIVYFRYAQRMVWDKRTRLDLIFGSTCEPGQPRTTITDVIRSMQQDEQRNHVAEVAVNDD